MKMWKRLVSAGLVAAMSGAMLAGCGNTAGNGAMQTMAAQGMRNRQQLLQGT